MGGDGGPCPIPKIIEPIMISIGFGEVEGDGGPCLTPKIIENIMIPIVFQEVCGDGGPCPTFEIIEKMISKASERWEVTGPLAPLPKSFKTR